MTFVKCSQYPSALYFKIDDSEIRLTPKLVQGPTIPCTGKKQKLISYKISYSQQEMESCVFGTTSDVKKIVSYSSMCSRTYFSQYKLTVDYIYWLNTNSFTFGT